MHLSSSLCHGELTRVAKLGQRWNQIVKDADAEGVSDSDADVATYQLLSIVAELAQTRATNIVDVAVKITVAIRELRLHVGAPLVEWLLQSVKEDCLRMNGSTYNEGLRER